MTLFRQVAVLISVIFVAQLVVLGMSDFRRSSRFLQGEMQTMAQDTATALGITVANASQTDDRAVIEALFNAVFDSGYYSRVELLSAAGEMLHEKTQPVLIRDVPAWFVEWVPLTGATGRSQVMKGWVPYGTLSVTLHPGYAYAGLYENLKSMLLWFAVVAVAGLTALWWLLRRIMQPLEAVRQQAEAIQENRFVRQADLPRTRELRQVAAAMNRMVDKVKGMFDEQTETLKRNHDLLYRDPLTGLGNRRYFVMKLNELCRDESASRGWLAMIHLTGLEHATRQHGHQAGEELLAALARMLEEHVGPQAREYCARTNTGEFALHLPGTGDEALQCLQRVFECFRSSTPAAWFGRPTWLGAGLIPVEAGCVTGELLAEVDFALTQAKAAGPYKIHRNEQHQPHLPQGKMQWRSWLEESLAANRLFLVGQEVQNRDGSVYHRELFVRMRDAQHRVIPAGAFMPVAATLGLESAIDRAVLQLALQWGGSEPIAINLSATFLNSADAFAEFERFVKRYRDSERGRVPLCVEVSHFAVLQHMEAAEHMADLLRAAECRFGVDRLDLGAPLQPLQAIRPHYVKIGARQLVDITEDRIQSAFQALRTLAGGLDMRLVAVGVDNPETFRTLSELGVDALQGNYLAEPGEPA